MPTVELERYKKGTKLPTIQLVAEHGNNVFTVRPTRAVCSLPLSPAMLDGRTLHPRCQLRSRRQVRRFRRWCGVCRAQRSWTQAPLKATQRESCVLGKKSAHCAQHAAAAARRSAPWFLSCASYASHRKKTPESRR